MSQFVEKDHSRSKKKGRKEDRASSSNRKRTKSLPIALESLDSDEYTNLLRTLHDNSKPYTHAVLDPFCDPDSLRAVYEEVKNNMTATFKETDLFKVFQTPELGTIQPDDELGKKMPELLKLRATIYSKRFRSFVERVTGCGELTDRVDLSSNAYTRQCHLMCHDDVISTRCVSFIIYLTDPDEEWTAADGGALELYPLDKSSIVTPQLSTQSSISTLSSAEFNGKTNVESKLPEQGIPAAVPLVNLLPKFNSMVMFKVQPGRSYHAVQEVFSENPRLSISGWFHAAEPPLGSDAASLRQVMSKGDNMAPFTPIPSSVFSGFESDDDEEDKTEEQELEDMKLPVSDLNALKVLINAEYLRPDSMLKIRNTFIEDSSVQLHDFLNEDVAKLIEDAAFQTDRDENLGCGRPPSKYTIGTGDGWSCVGPPHKHRYLRYDHNDSESSESPGSLISDVQKQLFHSAAFQRYLYKITNLKVTDYRDEIRRFRPGLDYTVAHHGTLVSTPRLDATLCFAETSDKDKAELWDGGDVGGFECYIAAEDDTDADATAEVYRSEQDENAEGDLLSVQAGCNVLNVVMRDEGVMKFVKYVSHMAPSSRWDLSTEYNVEFSINSDDDDMEDDTDDDSEAKDMDESELSADEN